MARRGARRDDVNGEDSRSSRLDERWVLITGAGGSIGTAMVEAFRAVGARAMAADRTTERVEPLEAGHEGVFDLTGSDGLDARLHDPSKWRKSRRSGMKS